MQKILLVQDFCLGQSLASTECLSETSSASVLHCQIEVLTASRVSEANCHTPHVRDIFWKFPRGMARSPLNGVIYKFQEAEYNCLRGLMPDSSRIPRNPVIIAGVIAVIVAIVFIGMKMSGGSS